MAQQVEHFPHKPDGLSSIPGTHRKEETLKFVELSSDLHTQMLWHMCAHTNISYIHRH